MGSFDQTFGVSVNLNVRCLIGLYGPHKDDGLDEAFSSILDEVDNLDEVDVDTPRLLQYALNTDDSDRVQFLVGSQSLRPNGSQITLVTLREMDEEEVDDPTPPHLTKQMYAHPDGEVVGLCALAAQPEWFISIFSSYSLDRPELRTGARVWRLPSSIDSGIHHSSNVLAPDASSIVPTSPAMSTLDYVTTLGLDNYSGIKKIASHPSTTCSDLACIVGPRLDPSCAKSSQIRSAMSNLVILQAPSESGSGDYRELASAELHLPNSSAIFTSYLKTNISHLVKTLNTNDHIAITSPPNALRWSSYRQSSQLAVAFESGVLGWDIRCMKPSFWLEAAHWPCVRDLDFNPHRPNLLATGGDDGCIRLWDLRYLKSKFQSTTDSSAGQNTNSKKNSLFFDTAGTSTEPLYSVQAHSHWVWSVRYHPTRDQLLLSAGSDCRVCLHNLSAFSSDTYTSNAVPSPEKKGRQTRRHSSSSSSGADSTTVNDKTNKPDNSLIARLEQHEESVYAVDWSPVDPWYFASISYDGNLLVNQVPEDIKLSILLDSNED